MGKLDIIKEVNKNPKKILDFLMLRENDYFHSQTFDKLKSRTKRALDSYNMRFNKSNQTMSKIAFPLVKERQLLRRAITKISYKADPLLSLIPISETSKQNAENMQDVLNLNLKSTMFRQKAFNPIINMVSVYGVGVMYQSFVNDQTETFRTVPTNQGVQRVKVAKNKRNVVHKTIHHLNYFQDTQALNAHEASFQGHIDEIRLSDLTSLVNDTETRYLQKQLKEVIADTKKSGMENDNYYRDNQCDENSQGIHLTRYFTTLPIKGNEDNTAKYYIERVGEKIIRIQEEIYDDNISPYTIFLFDKNMSYWWGNADAEYVTPHENFTNLLYGVMGDNAIQSTQRYRFYDKEFMSMKALSNRHKNNGWIPVDLKSTRSINDVVNQFQGSDNSLNSVQFIMQAIQQSAQSISTKTDLSRSPQQGGLQNKTATAAGMIQGQADMLDADLEETFGYALSEMGRKDTIMLQQFLGDYIRIKPDVKQESRILEKEDILGDFDYMVKTSMQKNNLTEAIRIQNAVTQLINMANSGRPEFQSMQLVDATRDWIKTLDIGEADLILPDVEQAQLPQEIPQLPEQAPQEQGLPQEALNVA